MQKVGGIIKTFRTGVIVGRFQHIHIGHEKLINLGLNVCDRLLVFVGSADKKNTTRNPYDVEYRIKLITKIFQKEIKAGNLIVVGLNDLTFETDVTPKWGEYVINSAEDILQEKLQCIIYGKDKNIFKCFDKKTVENLTEIFVDRNQLKICATDIRKFLLEDDEKTWRKYVNCNIYDEYEVLRKKLLEVEGRD